MPFSHPQGPVPIWPYNFHDVLDNGPFIQGCKELPVIAIFWIVDPLAGEFS